jgi:hypothetical protein
MIGHFRVGPMKPLDLKDLWTMGEAHQISLVRDSFLRNLPFRDWKHIVLGAWYSLVTWLIAEQDSDYFVESRKQANRVVGLLMTVLNGPSEEPLSTETIDNMANFYRAFDTDFRVELRKVPSYVLEEKRGYGVTTLVDKAHRTISVQNLGYLSEFATVNIAEAGRCFVFDCHTATGYHVSRAVEDVLRCYYTLVTMREPVITNKRGAFPRGFGSITNELKQHLDNISPNATKGRLPQLVPLLDIFCGYYRDALAHPDIRTLDEEEAADAFFQGINIISLMLIDVRQGGSHFSGLRDGLEHWKL